MNETMIYSIVMMPYSGAKTYCQHLNGKILAYSDSSKSKYYDYANVTLFWSKEITFVDEKFNEKSECEVYNKTARKLQANSCNEAINFICISKMERSVFQLKSGEGPMP